MTMLRLFDPIRTLFRRFVVAVATLSALTGGSAHAEKVVNSVHVLTELDELVDPTCTAVIVIDMQNEIVSTEGGYRRDPQSSKPNPANHRVAPEFSQQVAALHSLLKAARALEVPVIYAEYVHRAEDGQPLVRGPEVWCHRDSQWVSSVVKGSWEAQTVAELAPQAGELVVFKSCSNSFSQPSLDSYLKAQKIKCLLCTGTAGGGCVFATAMGAMEHGYYPVIVRDCVDQPEAVASNLIAGRFPSFASKDIRTSWRTSESSLSGQTRKRQDATTRLVNTSTSALSLGAKEPKQPVVPDPTLPGVVNYINPNLPEIKPPKFPGKYYEATVPATLDLAERGRLALNALTSMLNPNCDQELYFAVYHMTDPPAMVHGDSDLNTMGKYLEAIPLVRTMSGSSQNIDIEAGLMKTFLRMQGSDGLIYLPVHGRPWTLLPETQANSGMPGYKDGVDQVGLLGYGNARTLAAFLVYAQKDPNGPWAQAARNLAAGFKRTTIVDGDVAYTFSSWSTPDRKIIKPSKPPEGILGGMVAWIAQYLVMYDRAVGDPESTQIAQKMMHYTFGDLNYFDAHGKFLNDGIGVGTGNDHMQCAHFHTHGMNILAALYVVERTGDKWLLERARQAYEWAASHESGSEPLVGYFPEVTSDWVEERDQTKTSETCEVADMVQAGIMLSKLGIDKWDDVDRWVRNQLAENQLTYTGWRTDGHIDPSDFRSIESFPAGRYTTDRVLERTIGSFSGWASANDWVGRPKRRVTIMNCCSGSGARGLYAVWKDMISFDDGRLNVHLLLNRASRWADVESHIPFGKVRAGETVTLTFPIFERTDVVEILGVPYTLVRRGNDVVSIDPPGQYCPLYQRGHYRTGQTAYQKVTRFVSDEDFAWW